MDMNALGVTAKPNYAFGLEMLQNGEGTDCVIEVCQKDGNGEQEKEFTKVHKYVLMANSPVFRAMFVHESMKECREGHIRIEDTTATAVRQMVHFLYAGDLPPNYDVERDAIPLAICANKYGIKPLMEYNGSRLIESLSLANVFDRLELANLHQLDGMKYACGEMIYSNLGELKDTDKWAELNGTSKSDILEAMAEYHKKHNYF